jgi:hypothetical protein
MANDDRYGDRDRGQWRGNDRGDRNDWSRDRGGGGDDDRGFFSRAGEEVRSWFGSGEEHGGGNQDRGQSGGGWNRDRSYDHGYGRDRSDRSPGSHVDYYAGGERGQRRMGPEGGFEDRSDYRRTDRYADQGRSWGRGEGGERSGGAQGGGFSGSGGVNQGMGAYGGQRGSGYAGGGDDSVGWNTGGSAGPGFAPEFSGGPRFDRQDPGSTGTHGAHPVASPYGEAQTGYGAGSGGGFSSGGSARSRAILQQYEREHGRQGGQQGGQGQYGQQPQMSQQGGHNQEDHWRRQERSFSTDSDWRGGRSQHDPHYSEWRRRQIEEIDRDYDEYCRENASRFESEFGTWREKRGQQRQSMGRVTEHMEVVGSDGQHVGTVDKVANGRIILTKSDPNAGGHHHSIPCSWLESVDDKVRLNKTAEQAMQAWRDEETNRALFEDKDSGSEGPHILEKSFSGTYKDEDR